MQTAVQSSPRSGHALVSPSAEPTQDATFGSPLAPVDTGAASNEELWPFKIRVARSRDLLNKAVRLRQSAYQRHVPQFAATLGAPEAADFDAGTCVLLAESKFDGAPLGTMRVQTNRYKPLPLEGVVSLPDWLRGSTLAEAMRLGIVTAREGRLARDALFKAFYLACLAQGIDWMVITARAPLDKMYKGLMFCDVFPDAPFIPMPYIGDIPHRVLALRVADVKPLWQAHGHPLFTFFFDTRHPDLQPLHTEIGQEAPASFYG
jgi:hypothetical protein